MTRPEDGRSPGPPTKVLVCESQVGDFGPFLAMPAEQVEAAFGQESFRRRGDATRKPGMATLETALLL